MQHWQRTGSSASHSALTSPDQPSASFLRSACGAANDGRPSVCVASLQVGQEQKPPPGQQMETTAATADKKELKASVLDGGSGFSELPKKASPSGLSRGTAATTTLTQAPPFEKSPPPTFTLFRGWVPSVQTWAGDVKCENKKKTRKHENLKRQKHETSGRGRRSRSWGDEEKCSNEAEELCSHLPSALFIN